MTLLDGAQAAAAAGAPTAPGASQNNGTTSTADALDSSVQTQHQQPVVGGGGGGGAGVPELGALRSHVVNTLREWYVLASDSIASLLDGRFLQHPPRDLWLLGRRYVIDAPPGEQSWHVSYPPSVLSDFSSLVWCTYRSQYPPISPSAFTTDAGWGCMLRAGQTLMAQALQLHHLGRGWAFAWDSPDDADMRKREQYIRIVAQFFDDYLPSSTFSIHRMAALGKQFEGKDIGEWFGPSGTARILAGLARQAQLEVCVYTTTDGVVYLADICDEDEFRPTLILVASMLGIDGVNPVYYPFIQASLMLPQSVGIAGGRPSSALYFAGFQGDELIYLDPHHTRPAVERREDGRYSSADLASYSCSTPKRVAFSRLDPCMVFGYYCGSLESLIDLRSRIDLLADGGVATIISFDNGRSPAPAPPVNDAPEPASRQGGLLTKLSASPLGSSDGERSDEEWVTEL
ncbi:Cysteine protease atg4 [Coemansia biformis]|uniref:Cysteine protease n=1 Tax=Coemansia biformis TaxID=1286918 RepID=A0A9W7XY40_9FUNG|nr:Cysteine protease atg4 [Coemansia biformis]